MASPWGASNEPAGKKPWPWPLGILQQPVRYSWTGVAVGVIAVVGKCLSHQPGGVDHAAQHRQPAGTVEVEPFAPPAKQLLAGQPASEAQAQEFAQRITTLVNSATAFPVEALFDL